MKQNKQLIRCLKKKLYGGRGLFSRTVDYIALRAIVFMGCYMWFSAMVANGVAKAMLSLASTGFISVGLDLINRLNPFHHKRVHSFQYDMIQMCIYKLQDTGCILIKILQCMFYTPWIMKFSAFF